MQTLIAIAVEIAEETEQSGFDVFDIMDRLLSAGHKIEPPELEGQTWQLFSPRGSLVAEGETFRGLCKNILEGF